MAGPTGGTGYVRSPSDLLRLVLALVAVGLGLLVTCGAREALADLERAILELFGGLPPVARRFLVGAIQLVALAVPVVAAVTLGALRRWRTLALAALAGVAAVLVVGGVEAAADRIHPGSFEAATRADSWVAGAAYPGSAYLAGVAAAVTVIAPTLPRAWRRWAWGALAVVALGRVVSGTGLALDLVTALAAGWAVGLVVLLAFGVADRRPSATAVAAALREAGLDVVSLRPARGDRRGPAPFLATLGDGSSGFVRVLSSDERSADLLFRLYRAIRLENVGDERPFSSLRRAVEHEALVALRAASVGVRTPAFLGLAAVGGNGSIVLAYDAVEGRSLGSEDGADGGPLTDGLLDAVWAEAAVLRRWRIAHRDLRLANVRVDGAGPGARPWLVGFGYGELAASDELLAADLAELTMSTAVRVGARRAVAAAVRGVGRDAVAAAAPRLQPLALSGATRAGLAAQPGLDAEVRDEVARTCDLGEVELERIERVRPRAVAMLALGGVAAYALIHQLAGVGDLLGQVRDADWAWLPAILFLACLTFVGAALALAGAVPQRLPAGPLLLVELAGSFANRVTPAKVGGMAVNIRFLQKAGVEPPVAVTSVGLVSVFGFVEHVALIAVFALFAGQEGVGAVDLPSDQTVLAAFAAVLVLAGVVLVLPVGRRLAVDRLVPMVRRALGGARQVATDPAKLSTLVSGGVLITLSYLFCLYASLQAFGGGGAGLATVGFVYVTGTALASTAPTPGGVGAVEAVLIAGLTSVDVPSDVAVPSVFLFRLATFWSPVVPGWVALRHLTRRGML